MVIVGQPLPKDSSTQFTTVPSLLNITEWKKSTAPGIWPRPQEVTSSSPMLTGSSVFGIPLSVEIIIRPIVGGAGTVLGPMVGSFILSPLGEISRIYLSQGGWSGLHLIVYGLLLIVVVLFFPQGAYPSLVKLGARVRNRP